MEPGDVPPRHSPPRKVPIENEAFGYGNLEAWANIIRSYHERHREQQVILYYNGLRVQSLTYLFKLGKTIQRDGFELSVEARDQDFSQLNKLYRLLIEGAGPDFGKFLVPEVHRTLKLF
jgi:hypothetical protein